MSEKHKNTCRTLNYFEYSLRFIFAGAGCVSIYTFASLFGVPIGITSSTVGLKALVNTLYKYG